MKRRDFLKSAGISTLAAATFPALISADSKKTITINTEKLDEEKPAFKEFFTSSDSVRSGIALGGIGTGGIELRKNGQFYNWTIFNNHPFGTGPAFELLNWPHNGDEESFLFFIVRYQVEGEPVKLKLLQINNSLNEGGLTGIAYYFPWMSCVQNIEYSGRFPFVNMKFSDPEMPFTVEMESFSPFIPHDVKNSALPGIYFNFTIKNTSAKKVNVMLISSQRNLVGYDQWDKYFVSFVQKKEGYIYFNQSVEGIDNRWHTSGNMGMASLSNDTTYQVGWEHRHNFYENLLFDNKLPNAEMTEGRNYTDPTSGKKVGRMGHRVKDQRMFSSLAVTKDLDSNAVMEHSFVITWHFPNNYGAFNAEDKDKVEFDKPYTAAQKITKNIGHFYDYFFGNASEVAQYMVENKKDLSQKSKRFLKDFYASDIDQFVLDQINSQLNTFVTSSTLTRIGKFALREGMSSEKYWGPNNTMDVMLYGSPMVLALFPELQKEAIKTHRDVQTEKGEIAHGLGFDLDYTQQGTWGVYHRVDLPGNYIQMALRDFLWTNDRKFLDEIWNSVKDAVDYVLNERDKDKDFMPDMEGIMCSYDNFPMYGLSSYLGSQWITALTLSVEVSKTLGDKEFEKKCKTALDKSAKLFEEKLWNGKYYRLYNDYKGNKGIDEGCMTDQVIGQWIAHMSGVGYVLKQQNVKQALRTIVDMSYKKEIGLRNCSWPQYKELFPIHKSDLWVDQANTCWTGVELAFASFLIYEGLYEDALKVIKNVDDRYRKAGLYWDHQEFGGHYFRPMSAWSIVNAMLGMGVNQEVFSFAPKIPKNTFKMFFAAANSTLHYIAEQGSVSFITLSGEWKFKKIILSNHTLKSEGLSVQIDGKTTDAKIMVDKNKSVSIEWPQTIILDENSKLVIS